MIGSRHRVMEALLCGLLALGLPALAAPVAQAEVAGFTPADENIAEAQGPILPGTTYSGAFKAPSGQQDLDYLYFYVSQPETLRFVIENTLVSENTPGSRCTNNPYFEAECPMWATLVDEGGNQLGGEGSYSGTPEVDPGYWEAIEWTFSTPGRYYLVLESSYEGELPTFRFSYEVVPPGGGTGGGGTGGSGTGGGGTGTGGGGTGGTGTGGAGGGGSGGSGTGLHGEAGALKGGEVGIVAGDPNGSFTVSGSHALIESLTLPRRQRGPRVIVTAVLSQRLASLDLELLAPIGPHRRMRVVGHRLRRHPIAGLERIAVPVRAGGWLTSKRYVPLQLRVRALAEGGASELIQGRLLLRR